MSVVIRNNNIAVFDMLHSYIFPKTISRPTLNAAFACRSAARAEPNENVKSRLLHQTSGPVHASTSDERNQEQTHFQHYRRHSSAQHQRVLQIGEFCTPCKIKRDNIILVILYNCGRTVLWLRIINVVNIAWIQGNIIIPVRRIILHMVKISITYGTTVYDFFQRVNTKFN